MKTMTILGVGLIWGCSCGGGLMAAENRTDAREGLVASWPLDEKSGETIRDSSGNGHDGKARNVFWNSNGTDSAAEFNGTDGYAEIPHHPRLNMRGAFTLEAWVNLESVKGEHAVVSKGRGDCDSGYTFFWMMEGCVLDWRPASSRDPAKEARDAGFSPNRF
ncbi:MAG: hypothetical protein PHV34_12590 [Verrucomicrobiae bacterium]|nr:hypothetical protein [Verrucomicrobiae bacterium]